MKNFFSWNIKKLIYAISNSKPFILFFCFSMCFFSCQKDVLNVTPSLSFEQQSNANPLTIEMTQKWFESQFNKTLTITPPAQSLVTNTNGHYLDGTFQITPLWSMSEISVYLQSRPVVLVPVKPIRLLDGRNQEYALVFFRDSTNQITARLQVYEAVESYKRTHTNININDFSGFMYQIKLDGLIDNIVTVVNGRFVQRMVLRPNPNFGRGLTVTARNCDCWHPGSGEWIGQELLCQLMCWGQGLGAIIVQAILGDGGGGGGGATPTYTGTNTYLNWGQFNTGPGYINGDGSVNGSGGSGGTTNGNTTPPLVGEIDGTLFDVAGQTAKYQSFKTAYTQDLDFSDTDFDMMYNNRKLFTRLTNYFRANGFNTSSAAAIKNNMSFIWETDLFCDYLRLMETKHSFFNKSRDAGFPEIGSDAWYETLKFTYTSPKNGLNYLVNFPNKSKNQEALFAREFAEEAAAKVDASFDNTIKNIANTTTAKANAFANDIEINGGWQLNGNNRKAAILSYFVAAKQVVDPIINPNGISIFNNMTSTLNPYSSGRGKYGDNQNLVIPREDFNAHSVRSLNSIIINGFSSSDPNNAILITIELSLVDIIPR
jgi:hypothetical protein